MNKFAQINEALSNISGGKRTVQKMHKLDPSAANYERLVMATDRYNRYLLESYMYLLIADFLLF